MGADGSPGALGAPWRAAVAQLWVASLDEPVPDDADRHHLGRVLRLRRGEVVCAADGRGGYRLCRWGGDDAPLEPVGPAGHVGRPSPPLTVGFAPVKGDRPEWVVQKLTEVGVDVVVVLRAERSVVRWAGARAARQLERLESVARIAAAQCRRLWLPEVRLADPAAGLPPGALADAGGRSPRAGDTTLLVGPEGGWSGAERAGRELVALGDHVLRAETAALAAGVVLAGLRAGLVGPPGLEGAGTL